MQAIGYRSIGLDANNLIESHQVGKFNDSRLTASEVWKTRTSQTLEEIEEAELSQVVDVPLSDTVGGMRGGNGKK